MPSGVSEDVARYLRAMIPIWFNLDITIASGERPGAGKVGIRDVAKLLGVPAPSLQKLVREGKGAGIKFETAVAEKRYGGDVTKLRRDAAAWAEKNPNRVVVPENRERVFRVAAKHGLSAAEALEVGDSIAALRGFISDQEILGRFVVLRAQKELDAGAKAPAGRVIEEDDDLYVGAAALGPKVPRRVKT